jgi:hypothetical protein
MEYAIISAELSDLSAIRNSLRTDAFEKTHLQGVYQYHKVNGKYDGVHETSFIIYDIDIDNAIKIGKAFSQEAILTPFGLLYLEDLTFNPAKFKGFELVNDDDNYSEINGLKLRMPIDFDKKLQLQPIA